jgi:hypothetical protein
MRALPKAKNVDFVEVSRASRPSSGASRHLPPTGEGKFLPSRGPTWRKFGAIPAIHKFIHKSGSIYRISAANARESPVSRYWRRIGVNAIARILEQLAKFW